MSYRIESNNRPTGVTSVELWYARHTDSEQTCSAAFTAPRHIEVLEGNTRPGVQNEDGGVHLTHYDRDSLLSYVWDGRSDHIEVSHGGYAEPVFGIIPIDPDIIDVDYDVIDVFRCNIDREEQDPFVAAASCPKCGAAPETATEMSETVNTVEGFGLGTINITHKEHFGNGEYVLLCANGHEYPVPEGVEVAW